MTATIFLTLLAGCATLTSLVTEGIKKIMGDKWNGVSANLIACIVGLVVGTGATAVYYLLGGVVFTTINIVYMVLMGGASALVAMVGYDKVVQMIGQFRGDKNDDVTVEVEAEQVQE